MEIHFGTYDQKRDLFPILRAGYWIYEGWWVKLNRFEFKRVVRNGNL
jgi:hypothetical protein